VTGSLVVAITALSVNLIFQGSAAWA